MIEFLQVFGVTAGGVFALAVMLSLIPLLGRPGRALSDSFTRPPLLDIVLGILTAAPWLVGAVWAGWPGLGAAILGQMAACYAWIFFHELLHLRAARGPRIVHFTNRLVGRWHNHLALWLTTFGVPVLWIIRVLEIFLYPTLIWLLRFPRYRHADWITLSRHKMRDLVGHDLVWCLYCDWMTGTWSLGTEMLRNIESFWCPIRFSVPQKLENCKTNFPDIDGGWASADASMAEVVQVLEAKYGGVGDRSWFGHPARPAPATSITASHPANEFPPDMDELHRDLLVEHSRQPRNHRAMPDATHQADGELPICNDRLTVYLKMVEGRIADISFTATACPICTASASMMTQRLVGCTEDEARQLFQAFHDLMMRPGGSNGSADGLGELVALAGVHRFPSRIKCATLPWHTLLATFTKPVLRPSSQPPGSIEQADNVASL